MYARSGKGAHAARQARGETVYPLHPSDKALIDAYVRRAGETMTRAQNSEYVGVRDECKAKLAGALSIPSAALRHCIYQMYVYGTPVYTFKSYTYSHILT